MLPAGLGIACASQKVLASYDEAEGTRAAVKAWGLTLCAKHPKWHSDTVSALMMPPGVNAAEVIDAACRRYNLALGAGLARMARRLFRIGHLGDLNELMLLGAIAGAEMAMRDVGIKVTPGSGVAAAEEYWRGTRRRWRAGPARERRTPSRSSRRRGRPPPPDDPYPATSRRARGCSAARWRCRGRTP